MKFLIPAVYFIIFFVSGCLDLGDERSDESIDTDQESVLGRKKEIKELELKVEILEWENARLSLKLISVNGAALVLDKRTGLWHHDVDRMPFTGRATEVFPDGSPRGEADFHKGLKDGMERFWWPSGKLKEEGQWFAGNANGVFREWNERGEMLKIVRYKSGQLIDVIYERPLSAQE